jgi:uncharacterized protein YqjF (DUF2071 family)
MVNYIVDPEILQPYLPYKTEIDLWKGKCFVSLVGFRFVNTKVFGFKIPYHVNFEEVNLRFYVTHKTSTGEIKRGVVFIKEVVPRKAITFIANKFYHENYETMLMKHEFSMGTEKQYLAYFWGKFRWNSIWMEASNKSQQFEPGSEEEFITEHYWGYSKFNATRTNEYEVVHPPWEVYPVRKCYIDVSFDRMYGDNFGFLRNQQYHSVFLAEGSPIKVKTISTIK